jgi:hypothetical protein
LDESTTVASVCEVVDRLGLKLMFIPITPAPNAPGSSRIEASGAALAQFELRRPIGAAEPQVTQPECIPDRSLLVA